MRRQSEERLLRYGVVFAVAIAAAVGAGHLRSNRAESSQAAQPTYKPLVLRMPVEQRPATASENQHDMPSYPNAIMLEPRVRHDNQVQPAQACVPVYQGVDSADCDGCGELRWAATRPVPWQDFGQGEYAGPARTRYIPQYRLRTDDLLEFIYYFTSEPSDEAYRLGVGDVVVVESMTDPTLNRGDLVQKSGLTVQPDGTVTVHLLGQVPAAGRTVGELKAELEESYLPYYRNPVLTVTPLQTNAKLEALRSAIDSRFGAGGQFRQARITPEGTIQLPGIDSTPAHGLSIEELEREIEERYLESFGPGVNVTASLVQAAPSYVYVIGEVFNPGQIQLPKPTTAIQAISMAGGWVNGANLREIVVLRRAKDWRLMATKLDLRGALLGKRPAPSDEIWLRDSDVIIVPQSPIRRMDDFIELVFSRGIYGVVPFGGVNIGFAKASTI